MRRIAAILAMTLLVAACGDSATSLFSGGESTDGFAGQPPEAVRHASTEPTGPTDIGFENNTDAENRHVIRQAYLQIHATGTRDAFEEVTTLVESEGGFIAFAEVHPVHVEGMEPVISATLRIPSQSLTATMHAIKDMADEVVSELQSARDVSDQFVDLEARLRNLEALETELRGLLAEVREQPDADPEALLRVFNELSSVRGQIEQLQGQINHLSNQAELATLELGITQTPAATPLVTEAWTPLETAKEAARNLVTALQNFANRVISFFIYTLPVLILLVGPPLLVLYLVYRRWWKDRDRGAAPPVTPAEA